MHEHNLFIWLSLQYCTELTHSNAQPIFYYKSRVFPPSLSFSSWPQWFLPTNHYSSVELWPLWKVLEHVSVTITSGWTLEEHLDNHWWLCLFSRIYPETNQLGNSNRNPLQDGLQESEQRLFWHEDSKPGTLVWTRPLLLQTPHVPCTLHVFSLRKQGSWCSSSSIKGDLCWEDKKHFQVRETGRISPALAQQYDSEYPPQKKRRGLQLSAFKSS